MCVCARARASVCARACMHMHMRTRVHHPGNARMHSCMQGCVVERGQSVWNSKSTRATTGAWLLPAAEATGRDALALIPVDIVFIRNILKVPRPSLANPSSTYGC